MTKKFFVCVLSALFLAILLISGNVEAKIQRIDICGVQFQPSEAVPVIREVPTFVTVRGDFVNTNTSIEKNSLISITQTGSTSGGGVSTSITLKITPSASIGTGNHTIKLHYAIEVNGPDVFTINVPGPKINSITINPNKSLYNQGDPVTITASGSGLTGAHFNSTFTVVTNIHYITTNSTTVSFSGNLARSFTLQSGSFTLTNLQLQDTCLSNHVAGNFAVGVNVSTSAPPPPPPPTSKGGNPPPQQPDLTLLLLNTFRSGAVFGNNETSTYNLCPTSKANDPKTTTIPALTIRVSNAGNANAGTPFTVRVTRNGATTNTFTVNSLNAGATTDFVIPRAENRVCATLDTLNPAVCRRCGSGIVPIWNDLGISVTVDPAPGTVTESNENNNTQTIQ